MKNTILAQDHPLVAVANRNVQTINEYKYFEEMSYDIEDIYAEGITSSCSVSELFYEDDDLPF